MHYRINFSARERRRYQWRRRGWQAGLLLPCLVIIGMANWLYRGETEDALISEIARSAGEIETVHEQLKLILDPLQQTTALVGIPRDHAATIQHTLMGTTQSRQHQLIPRRFAIEPDGTWQLDMFHVMDPGLPSYAQEAELARSNILENLPDITYTANWPAKEIGEGRMQLHITLSGKMPVPEAPDFEMPSGLERAWQLVQEHRTAMRAITRPSTRRHFAAIRGMFSRGSAQRAGETTFLESVRTSIADLVAHPDESVRTQIRTFNAAIDARTDSPGRLMREITLFLAAQGLDQTPQHEALKALEAEWEQYAKRRFCMQHEQLQTLCVRRDTLRALRPHIPSPEQVATLVETYHTLRKLPSGWFSFNDHLKEQRPKELLQYLMLRQRLSQHLQFSFPPKEKTGKNSLLPDTNPLFQAIEWSINLKEEKEGQSTIVAYADFMRLLETLEQAQGLFLPRSILLSFRIDNPGILDALQLRGILPLFDMDAVDAAFQIPALPTGKGGTHGD